MSTRKVTEQHIERVCPDFGVTASVGESLPALFDRICSAHGLSSLCSKIPAKRKHRALNWYLSHRADGIEGFWNKIIKIMQSEQNKTVRVASKTSGKCEHKKATTRKPHTISAPEVANLPNTSSDFQHISTFTNRIVSSIIVERE